MDEKQIFDEIAKLAMSAGADALSESMVSLTHGDLFEAALEVYGSWDVALAKVLVAALSGGMAPQKAGRPAPPPKVDSITRDPHPDAMRPLIALTDRGYVLRVPAGWLTAGTEVTSPRDPTDWPSGVGRPLAFADLDAAEGLAGLSDDGRLFGWVSRLTPHAEVGEGVRRLGAAYGVVRWVALEDREAIAHRAVILTVSARGKVKASDSGLLPHPLTTDGVVACLVDEGDSLVDVIAVGANDTVMLVSSGGYAIAFDREEVRPMGLRAAGVKGMSLRGDAQVIAALLPQRHSELAVCSRLGFAKRMPLDEFRPQSRAGLGLVASKQVKGDRLAAACGCDFNTDLLVTTSHGRCLRLAAESIPVMGRPARGQKVIELDDGEEVVDLARLLPA